MTSGSAKGLPANLQSWVVRAAEFKVILVVPGGKNFASSACPFCFFCSASCLKRCLGLLPLLRTTFFGSHHRVCLHRKSLWKRSSDCVIKLLEKLNDLRFDTLLAEALILLGPESLVHRAFSFVVEHCIPEPLHAMLANSKQKPESSLTNLVAKQVQSPSFLNLLLCQQPKDLRLWTLCYHGR